LVSDQSVVQRAKRKLAVEVVAAAVVEAARAVVVVHSQDPVLVVAAWAPRATVATV
jgi:hypothetical protein